MVGCRRRGESDEKAWVRAGRVMRWDEKSVGREGGPAFGQLNGARSPRKSQRQTGKGGRAREAAVRRGIAEAGF